MVNQLRNTPEYHRKHAVDRIRDQRGGGDGVLDKIGVCSQIVFVIVVAALLAFTNEGAHRLVAIPFVVGALCSGLAGFFGMRVATSSNTKGWR